MVRIITCFHVISLNSYCTIIAHFPILLFTPIRGIIFVLSFPYWATRKGGANMQQELIYLLKSIAASIIAYYICKWLDRFFKDNQYEKGLTYWEYVGPYFFANMLVQLIYLLCLYYTTDLYICIMFIYFFIKFYIFLQSVTC